MRKWLQTAFNDKTTDRIIGGTIATGCVLVVGILVTILSLKK